MLRKMIAVLTLLIGASFTAASAQEPGCEFCGNHFFYQEHAHGNELDSEYDNEQNHGSGWYAGWCGVDHNTCQETLMAQVDLLQESTSDERASDLKAARLASRLTLAGVSTKLTPAGLRLTAKCSGDEGVVIALSPEWKQVWARTSVVSE